MTQLCFFRRRGEHWRVLVVSSEAPPQTVQTTVGSRLAARLFSMAPLRGPDISGGPRKS